MSWLIWLVDTITDILGLLLILAMMGFGIYVLWDEQNIYQSADASVYEIYHPDAQDSNRADELAGLRARNPDVIAWLQIDDTQIDYPVVRGEDNLRYVSTDVFGKYSLSGSIFLDYRDAVDFSSPNSILYGHHMAKDTMFGQLDEYQEYDFFQSHRTDSLYYESAWHPLMFFAFLEADAYDRVLYDVNLTQCGGTAAFYSHLRNYAEHFEEVAVSINTRFITLSTCHASGGANSRYLLIGVIEEAESKYSE